jgi:hypothetical protein
LSWRILRWKRIGSHIRANQFVVLILNLVLADLQQSMAFMLNSIWVMDDAITTGSVTCWVQGWFFSTGNLSSGLFTLLIAVHTLADIVFHWKPSHTALVITILSVWVFTYGLSILGISMHPNDFYTKAGAWCWINNRYNERVWLHYFWIIFAELATIAIYAFIFAILHLRVRRSFYSSDEEVERAKKAALIIIAYPLIYAICTAPLVVADMRIMFGADVSYIELIVAACFVTSNGWLDVVLYSFTRRSILFGSDMTNEDVRAIDTFTTDHRFRPDGDYGTTTVIEVDMPRHPGRVQKKQALDLLRHHGVNVQPIAPMKHKDGENPFTDHAAHSASASPSPTKSEMRISTYCTCDHK